MIKSKSRFLLIFLCSLSIILLYFGWKTWSVATPYLLPQNSVASAGQSDDLSDGHYYEIAVPPAKGDKYLSAHYRLWLPEGVQTIRGLIVKQHGCGDAAAATGLDHADDLQWQALAVKHQFALLGTKLPTGDQSCDNWAVLSSGTERAFFKALHAFAQISHHSELDTVPWVLWGHSGGADWAMQMLEKHPDRTIAAVAMRCGGVQISGTPTMLYSKIDAAVLGVPVLFALGENDPYADECLFLPRKTFLRYRQAGALWAVAVEANTAHESGDTRLLAIPYFDTLITARLLPQETDLRPVDATQGWLGNPAISEIAPVNQYQGDVFKAAWLPNEETARKWQDYLKTGKISPTEKPAAPTDVRATKVGANDVVLTWSFTPDLENGLPSFRIYRNGSLIKTLQGQGHNFGDAPEPARVVLEFRDELPAIGSVYAVAAFNALGESVSQPVQVADR